MAEAGGSPTATKKHTPHHDYTYLTSETATTHTVKQLMRHFATSEQGIKNAMTRKHVTECLDMVHTPSGWKSRDLPHQPKPLPGETKVVHEETTPPGNA